MGIHMSVHASCVGVHAVVCRQVGTHVCVRVSVGRVRSVEATLKTEKQY